MPITSNLEEFARLLESLPRRTAASGRAGLLALDVSKRAIGLAGADPSWSLVTPLQVIRRRTFRLDVAALRRTAEERAVGALVIGYPLNMDGSAGPRCQSVRQFAADLDREIALPTLLFDERLSTFEAKERALAMGLDAKKAAAMLDAIAAASVLEDALKALAKLRPV